MKLKNIKFGMKVVVKNNQNSEHSVFDDINSGKEGFVVYLYEDGDVKVYFPTNNDCVSLGYMADYGHHSNLKLVKEVNVDE